MNSFLKATQTQSGSAQTKNGAVSYASTGSELVDQFGKAASYIGRDISVVFDDQKRLWDENPEAAIRFPFYLRLITRQSKISRDKQFETEKVQRGAGVRDEAYKRLLWVAYNHPQRFYDNIWLLPFVGSWKDLWTIMFYDVEYGSSKLDRRAIYSVIADGLVNELTADLAKKYLPRIRSTKKCKTSWAQKSNELAKDFVAFLNSSLRDGFDYRDYRELKAEGGAHRFQQLITAGKYDEINFKGIPGKALLNMATGKFLSNHGLSEKYTEWIKSQPVAKFNGYPYELGMKLKKPYGIFGYGVDRSSINITTKLTIDKQFESLIQTAKKDEGAIKGNVWCAIDTSGSMCSAISNKSKVTAYDVCASLGIFFSTLNEGAFHKNVIMFDDTSRVLQLRGSFTEMWEQLPRDAMGSTNFQSVIDTIVRVRLENPSIPVSDYPSTLLVVSDMQFNPTKGYYGCDEKTNWEETKAKLKSVFPEEFANTFKVIWWNVNGRYGDDMPSTLDDAGTYFFSGFDGSVISFLLGGQPVQEGEKPNVPSMEEIIDTALSQEIFSYLR